MGSPHQITNASGAAVWQWNHDPFGNGDPTGTFTYDLRFPGQFHDQATHLHYNYFRDYDPRLGRYIESDPIGLGGWHQYVCPNSPANTLIHSGKMYNRVILRRVYRSLYIMPMGTEDLSKNSNKLENVAFAGYDSYTTG